MPDALFADPRLVGLYDLMDPVRPDLDHYVAIAEEFGARSVLDVGCGTGCLALQLAERGLDVVGVDPARASLDLAQGKPGADRIRWIHGDATSLGSSETPGDPPIGASALPVDMAIMTGNVAQVFLEDADWQATVAGVRGALVAGGRFVFETRDPSARGWEVWNRDDSFRTIELPDGGTLEAWLELQDVDLPLVSFRGYYRFDNGTELKSDSTLRFRDRDEIEHSLTEGGFHVDEVRGAPDRPGLEFVFIARRLD